MLFVFIYAYRCPRRFSYQMIFMTFNSTTTCVTRGTTTANPFGAAKFLPLFNGVRVAHNLQFSVQYYRNSLFVLQYFFLWSLYCLFFFELRLVITPFVSSNVFHYTWCRLHNSKDRAPRTSLITEGEIKCSRRVSSYCSTSDTHRLTVKRTSSDM